MLLYRLLRFPARLAIRTFYKKIYLTGLDNYPKDKPVILALNHPTAFVEPCILATTLEDELHFLVRGDFFRKPLYNKLLRSCGCLPVFRMKDGGYENIKNNYSTFNVTFEALKNGEPIVILAEGTSIHEKRLRPLKKGTARLALGTMQQYGADTDVHIVPIGVNYTYAERFRSEVMIEFAEPIRALDYWETYQENNAKGIRDLTDELKNRLKKKVVIINEKKDEDLVEKLFVLTRNGKPMPVMPVLSKRGSRFKMEKRISSTVNKMTQEQKKAKTKAVNAYLNNLQSFDISDLGLTLRDKFSWGSWLVLIVGFVPALLGYLLSLPPLLLTKNICDNKIKHIEYHAPVAITVGLVAYLLWWLILMLVTGIIGSIPMFTIAFLMPFLGFFSLIYKEYYHKVKEGQKANKLSDNEAEKLLTERRNVII